MSETTATATAAKKTAEKVVEIMPAVLETAEVAVQVPTKVALRTPTVVAVSLLAGAGLGAGVLWGVHKFRTRNKLVVEVDESEIDAVTAS